MEGIINREKGLSSILWQALLIAAVSFAMVVIVYGMESVAPGVHDAFHDFRHTIGMPCH